MTVTLCIRQGSKRNDDSVSVEELDWSAERQVLIPAEHLWCDFKCRPWDTNSSPNTNDLYIHYMGKSTGTPPSSKEQKGTSKLWQQINQCTYKLYFHLCCNSFEVYEITVHICYWCLVMHFWHCHVRIEKDAVQTVTIKLEAHNSLEYHYMLKH